MTASPTFNTYYTQTQQHQNHPEPHCTLQWRRGQLLVKSIGTVKQPYLAALAKEQSLVECLKNSPIHLVRIDPKLGEAKLLLWASACEQANKPIFIHIPSADMPKPGSSLLRLTNWIVALAFLLFMSPVMLGLVLLIRLYSLKGSLLSREWHVGERGKLFRLLKFRTTEEQNITPLGRWMLKYGLNNMPLLLNVLRGEMNLTGLRCLTLEEAVRLSSEQQRHLNKQPGILGSWEVEASNLLHLDSQTL